MSDSYRKPYYPNSGGATHWKKKANRKLRRGEKNIGNNNNYRKFNDIHLSPMEYRGVYSDVPKLRRK
jgi:hypothetical protein